MDILRGKQSNAKEYPAYQVPVVPILFTVVSWVIDDILVVVHSCTDEKISSSTLITPAEMKQKALATCKLGDLLIPV